MYINQLKSEYCISNRGFFKSSSRKFFSNKNKVVNQLEQSPSVLPKKTESWGAKIQKFAKKLSDVMLKILDTF